MGCWSRLLTGEMVQIVDGGRGGGWSRLLTGEMVQIVDGGGGGGGAGRDSRNRPG